MPAAPTPQPDAAPPAPPMFRILNRWSDAAQFECELSGEVSTQHFSLRLGFAVRKAISAQVSLIGARLDGASLDGASLIGARLVGARLDGASLIGARLDGASLIGARLDGARLVGARLDGASLVGARLDGASLVGARLVGARLVGASLKDVQIRHDVKIQRAPLVLSGLDYPVVVFDEHMQIGCEFHTLADWTNFDDRRITQMDGRNSLRFWTAHRTGLLAFAAGDKRGLAPIADAATESVSAESVS